MLNIIAQIIFLGTFLISCSSDKKIFQAEKEKALNQKIIQIQASNSILSKIKQQELEQLFINVYGYDCRKFKKGNCPKNCSIKCTPSQCPEQVQATESDPSPNEELCTTDCDPELSICTFPWRGDYLSE